MNDSILLSIAATGLVVSFAHAALPTHWLPFVLAGRGQGWSKSKTLSITALASLGHVLFTTLLGIIVVFFGFKVEGLLGGAFPLIVGGLLFAFGLYYFIKGIRGGGGHHHWKLPWPKKHSHGHHDHDHDHPHHHDDHHHDHTNCKAEPAFNKGRSDKAVIIGLLALLTFSPCEGFLPVYLSGIQYGWTGFALLSVILAAGTMAGMIFFTWLTMAGMEKFRLDALEKYEAEILGLLLCILGFIVIVFEH